MPRNLPGSGGQRLERDANTAYVLREKVGALRTSRYQMSLGRIS